MNTPQTKIEAIKDYYMELDQAEILDCFDWSEENIDEEFSIIQLMREC